MTDKYAKPFNGLDRYAVVGNPIAHSKSPLIHEAFAKQTNQDISYERILAPLDGFEATVRGLIAKGYKGANVTVPFKFEAYKICDSLTTRVVSSGSGAVNTLINIDGKILGDNTDGVGLRSDIEQNLKFPIADKNILILGAGGAAHGVLNSLVGAKSITIANRTSEKALQLVMSISDINDVRAKMFDELDVPYDLIINATSTGLTDTALPISNIIFAQGCLAYDMMYGRETPFMRQARENGAQVADGLGMLVEQAAEAFYIWRGVRPETQSVIQQIRSLA
ncbi:shikimate dehydrogenase [Methylotenera sp.]|uniref:shikimate dehydrogenase n=1 Tax=Methylotenera sp. TaxID=2051956 RepID=UPI0024898B0F|nr:shikimate dehydrogenase [Methylotenera sp.]MDI1297603.1 shikimate dehydrogenase [Methylotenera sp.]